MDNLDKKMSELLGLPAEVPKSETKQEIMPLHKPEKITGDHIEDDYNLTRDTLRNIVKNGDVVIDEMIALARNTEHPRAYEVLAQMMKTVAETSNQLYDLQKKKKDILTDAGKKKVDEGAITVEKAVFVGTTSDLLKQIKAKE